MASKTVATKKPEYEFLGPPGAFAISFLLPVLVYFMTFACNDVSGCPAPSLLSPRTLSLQQLKAEVGWPADGIWGLGSWKALWASLAYIGLSLVLYRVLPAHECEGTELRSGGRLKYRFNTLSSAMTTFALLGAGTLAQGAEFPVWTFISDNYVQLVTVNLLISYALAIFLYVKSFSVKPGNKEKRELAAGGQTGNMLYDWFIGRELNPRVTIPWIGEVDLKEWCELRPGMMGWAIVNWAWCAKQYRTFGYITDSIICISAIQTLYIIDSWWNEPAITTTMDITTDGFGMMLCFADFVWEPFIYSLQTRYLAHHPVTLGPVKLAMMFALIGIGFYIFRSANSQKNTFRTTPDDPSVAHLTYIETKTGSRLITSGWWGLSRHINYFGDWIQSWPYCLPTGVAGYQILAAGTGADGAIVMRDGREVVQGDAKGWAIPIAYFYVVYFAILLLHRERRDDEKCHKKYGKDWEKYRQTVRYRIIPGVY